MNRPVDRNLIILSGGSGTGKSTLAKALQALLLPEVWLTFSVDTLFYCLPDTLVDRVNTRNDWSGIDAALLMRDTYRCARTLLDNGNRLLFDCVIASEKGARNLLEGFQAFSPVVVHLNCSLEETKRRTLARGDRTWAEAEHGFHHAAGHLAADLTFDTTHADPLVLAHALIESLGRCPEPRAWDDSLTRYGIGKGSG